MPFSIVYLASCRICVHHDTADEVHFALLRVLELLKLRGIVGISVEKDFLHQQYLSCQSGSLGAKDPENLQPSNLRHHKSSTLLSLALTRRPRACALNPKLRSQSPNQSSFLARAAVATRTIAGVLVLHMNRQIIHQVCECILGTQSWDRSPRSTETSKISQSEY